MTHDMNTLHQLTTFLDDNQCVYTLLEHKPYSSSAEATAITGILPTQAAKSLLYQTMTGYLLAVLPASERASSGKLRRAAQIKSIRLAPPDIVEEVMGCKVGTCHPLGRIASVHTIVDPSLARNAIIGFSTGDARHTITMPYIDYERIAHAQIADIRSAPSSAQ